jgi:hypothetical protein
MTSRMSGQYDQPCLSKELLTREEVIDLMKEKLRLYGFSIPGSFGKPD